MNSKTKKVRVPVFLQFVFKIFSVGHFLIFLRVLFADHASTNLRPQGATKSTKTFIAFFAFFEVLIPPQPWRLEFDT